MRHMEKVLFDHLWDMGVHDLSYSQDCERSTVSIRPDGNSEVFRVVNEGDSYVILTKDEVFTCDTFSFNTYEDFLVVIGRRDNKQHMIHVCLVPYVEY